MSISHLNTINFAANERNMGTAITIDTTNGFVYTFYMTPTAAVGGIAKIQTSDFTRIANTTYSTSPASSSGSGAAIDVSNDFACICAGRSIKKLTLSSFGTGLSSDFWEADGQVVLDSSGTTIYTAYSAALGNRTARRFLTSSFALNSQLVIGDFTAQPRAVAVDFVRGFMWVGRNDTSGQIVKIRLSDFTLVNTLSTGLTGGFYWAAPDTLNDKIYMYNRSNRIVSINLATDGFSISGVLPSAVGAIGSLVAAPNAVGGGVIYLAASKLWEIDINTLVANQTFTLGSEALSGICRDPSNGRLYVSTNGNPGAVHSFQGIADIPSAVPRSGGPNVKRRPYPYNAGQISGNFSKNRGGFNEEIHR